MSQSETPEDLEFHLHALSNAGEAVPLEFYSAVLDSPIHIQAKDIAVNALSNRVSEEGDEETTAMLHSILASNLDEAIKVSAVKAQTMREHVLQNGASLMEFRPYLQTATPVLSKALNEYFEEAGVAPEDVEEFHANTLSAKALFSFGSIGRAISSVGRSIGNVAKKVVSTVSNVVGKAVSAIKNVVGGIADIAGAAGKFADNLKSQFGAASFDGEAVCIPVNNKKETICMHDEDMVAFIRSQGDLSVMKWSKQFEFEKLVGAKVLHVYIGAIGYGGTNIDCENGSLDAVFFAMGLFYASAFSRKTNILTMSIQLAKRPDQDLNDLAFVKIGAAVLVNQPYVPDEIRKIINTCDKITKPLFHQAFNNLAQFSYSFVVVVVPVKLSFVLSAEMGVDLVVTLCPGKLVLTAGVEPWFTLSVKADAGISILIATGGISVTASFNYRLKPSVGTANCNICAVLAHQIKPISILVTAFVEAIIVGRKDFEIYKFDGPTIDEVLLKKCLTNGKYDPEGTMAGTTDVQGTPPDQVDQSAPSGDSTGTTDQGTQGTGTNLAGSTSSSVQNYGSSGSNQNNGNQGGYSGPSQEMINLNNQWDYLMRTNAYNAQQWYLYEQQLWQFNQQKRSCNCKSNCGKKKCNGCGKCNKH